MQVVCIYSGVSAFEQKLDYIFNILKSTLEEIDVEVLLFDVSKLNISFFNGTKVPIIETIFNNIKSSNGIIFATTARCLAPNGAMQCFLEHIDYNLYGNILKDKICFPVVTSTDNSEYMAGNYINTLISNLEGIPINGMFIGNQYLRNIETSIETTQMIERYAEEFYRCFRQNRRYFSVKPFKNESIIINNTLNETKEQNNYNKPFYIEENNLQSEHKVVKSLTGSQVAGLYEKGSLSEQNFNIPKQIPSMNSTYTEPIKQQRQEINYNNIYGEQTNFTNNSLNQSRTYEYNKNSFDTSNFNAVQEDDISEITKLLSQKYKAKEEVNLNNQFIKNINETNMNNSPKGITPSVNTLRQRTQSLYHYFQPQLAKDINIIIQVLISGRENFDGYFIIKDGECTYTDGINISPDISIISDALVWEEVLKGQSTLQKAFMLGRLKVKGNFVMVSKFEQFFKIG